MWAKVQSEDDLRQLHAACQRWLKRSRFTANLIPNFQHMRHRTALEIRCVRLKHRKDYCGQHPGPCQNLIPRKHQCTKLLEGADWVGFNDGLNTVCDLADIHAVIWSYNREALGSRFYTRKGYERRVNYVMEPFVVPAGTLYAWSEADDSDFLDCRDRPTIRSEYPQGTPGIASWRLASEVRNAVLYAPGHEH